MKKNDYSELNLYNKKDEIFGCVHPRFGRVAIWNDSADFLFKPPSMFFERAESSLLIKATTNKTKFEESQKQYEVIFQVLQRFHVSESAPEFTYWKTAGV